MVSGTVGTVGGGVGVEVGGFEATGVSMSDGVAGGVGTTGVAGSVPMAGGVGGFGSVAATCEDGDSDLWTNVL